MPQGSVLPVMQPRAADLAATAGSADVAGLAEGEGDSFGQLLLAQMAQGPSESQGQGAVLVTAAAADDSRAQDVTASVPPDSALVAALLGVGVAVPPSVAVPPGVPLGSAVALDGLDGPPQRGRAVAVAGAAARANDAVPPVRAANGGADTVDDGTWPSAAAADPARDIPGMAATFARGRAEPDGATSVSAVASSPEPSAESLPAPTLVNAVAGEARRETAGTSVPTTAAVGPALHTPKWGDAFADRVLWVVHAKQPVAELQLNPPQLGPVEVRVSVTADQASLSFFSGQASVREAIQAALPRLQEALAASGLTLGGFHVGAEAQQQRHFAWDHAARQSGGQARAGAVERVETVSPAPAVARVQRVGPGILGVDLFA